MRVGTNPEKFKKELHTEIYHRVVVPVFIPELDDYFKDGLKIFRLNLESLIKTIHTKTRITIYNNNSHPDVKKYIDEIFLKYDVVDQVFHSKQNLGKINGILAAVKGNLEPLITISDSDVFFKHNWQENIEQIFIDFPNAGTVSPVPNSVLYKYYTANNFFQGFLGNAELKFHNVKQPEAMQRFEDSLGDDVKLYNQQHLQKYMILENKKSKAVMGAGHFVATIRREVFDKGTTEPAFLKIMGGVESKFIDKPNEDLGFLRLSTISNFAYHLGNTLEDWMQEEFKKLDDKNSNPYIKNFSLSPMRPASKIKIYIGKLLRKILLHKLLKKHYFKTIGLENAENY